MEMAHSRAKSTPAGPTLLVTIALVATFGWIVMLAQHQSGHGMSGPHFGAGMHGSARVAGSGAWVWLSGWGVMILAMMLPPALPLFRAVERLAGARSDGASLIAATATAFLLVWLSAGLGLWLAGTAAANAAALIPGASTWSRWASGGAVMLAGLYQFTPLKKACLTSCRSPVGIVMTHWNGRAPRFEAARIGVHFGAVCVGCCWALMLLTLAVGTFAMPLMVVVSLFMLAERMLPSVRALIPVQAGFAFVIGLLIISGALPPGFLFV
jgi:predicted metal-binding membrane protein